MRTRISQKAAVGTVYVAAMFMSIMDTTIVNVALPTIGRSFGVPATSVDTVSIYFLVSLAVFIPASGWLGDRFGGKRVLLTAIVVFTGASALCGLATSLTELEVFRVLQGVGGGMLAPVGLAMLFRAFPPAERVRAAAVLTIPTTMAPALGPVVGGLLVTDLSWRWCFYVNLPIGMVALLFGLLFVEGGSEHPPGPFDTTGFVLAGAGLGALMYGVSEGPIRQWGSAGVLGPIVAGAVLVGALIVVELRKIHPLIDLRLLGDRLFRSNNGVMILGSAAFLGTLYVVSLFYQDGRGLSALASGLSTFPEAIGVMLGAQLASRVLYPSLGPRRHLIIGLCGIALTVALMALVGPATNLWWMRALMFALGFSMGQVFVPSQAAAFATISPAATGRASTMFNAVRQLGSAIGVAVFTTAVVAVGATRTVGGRVTPNLSAYHVAFLIAAAFALLGAAVANTVSDRDAASTIQRRARRRSERGEEPVGPDGLPVAAGPRVPGTVAALGASRTGPTG
ncbi:MAG TPA: MDR family MFS transporter [Acidimicrobiales bacterium]|nr:MDR family MFS transporter [Acidimicrobiales bacterium]